MYVIVDIAGKQYKAEKDKFLYTPLQDGKEGSKVDFDKVLLVDDAGKVKVGDPTVKGAKVSGKILEHVKDDKVVVFKKKRRKGYKVKNGHRQQFSKILIEDIKG
ncbi:MAG: 50S ribosomal protein L21 [Cyclobacteriaceae bacterium]